MLRDKILVCYQRKDKLLLIFLVPELVLYKMIFEYFKVWSISQIRIAWPNLQAIDTGSLYDLAYVAIGPALWTSEYWDDLEHLRSTLCHLSILMYGRYLLCWSQHMP